MVVMKALLATKIYTYGNVMQAKPTMVKSDSNYAINGSDNAQ